MSTRASDTLRIEAAISLFDTTGEIAHLNNAITRSQAILAALPPEEEEHNEHRTDMLLTIVYCVGKRFELLGEIDDLHTVIQAREEMLPIDDGPDQAKELSELGEWYARRFKRSGLLEDLETVVLTAEGAVALTDAEDPERAARLSVLGEWYIRRFKRLGHEEDLENALNTTEEALDATDPDDPERARRLSSYGKFLHQSFERSGSVDDLDIAIEMAGEAVTDTPDGPDRVQMIDNLVDYLFSRFKLSADLEDLERAIEIYTEVVEAAPPEDRSHPSRVSTLGSFHFERYNRLGAAEDLATAIEMSEEALAGIGASPGHSQRLRVLGNLAMQLGRRFERFGDVDDLHNAIRSNEEAIAGMADRRTDLNRPRALNNLSTQYFHRYTRFGDLDDIGSAIHTSEAAIAATAPDCATRAGRLCNLGKWYHSRFQRSGEVDDLETAIRTGLEALAGAPAGHVDRASLLGGVSSWFASRFRHLGALEDLQTAIEMCTEAVEGMKADDPGRAIVLHSLSIDLSVRFERLQSLDELEKAIEAGEEALASTRANAAARAGRLSSLGSMFHTRYSTSGGFEDLEKAINMAEEAVEETPEDDPHRSHRLRNFGLYLLSRYEEWGAEEDLQEAICATEEAVAATPLDSAGRGHILLSLVWLLKFRAAEPKFNASDDIDQALELSLEAWGSEVSPPRVRINAAIIAAELLSSAGRWTESNLLLSEAVRMLPKLTPNLLAQEDKQHMLARPMLSQLAADSASTSLQAGESAYHCLSLLELGRGIIMGLTIDCRGDLSALRTSNQDLYETFNRLRVEVDAQLGSSNQESDHLAGETRRRRTVQASGEIDDTLACIRQLPGFERFQLPPTPETLIAMASEGPIVIINTTNLRSDAIIVTSEIKSLALPDMVFAEVEQRMQQLGRVVRGSRSTYPARNRELEGLLLWLWEVAVGPVFGELGFTAAGNGVADLPRVWWIGVGPLAMAPFHAAGDHSRGSTRNTISQAISSYTPTIKTLSYARQKKLEFGGPDSRLLLVGMPTTPETPAVLEISATTGSPAIPGTAPVSATPNCPAVPRTHGTPAVYATPAVCGTAAKRWTRLPNATKELDDILLAVEGRQGIASTRLISPTVAQLTALLPTYHAIHFACHAVSDEQNPSNSHLLLNNDSGPGKLTVQSISALNIPNAQIVYLSACCTADNASAALADESIHIASGFQLAGFSHVLATRWQADDAACRSVARVFYQELHATGDGHRVVSMAFHRAVVELRSDFLGQPIKWASFIHTGA